MPKYLIYPRDLIGVGKKLGFLSDLTYNQAKEKAEKLGIPNPKLIVTIKFLAEYVSMLPEQNFPISHIEWEKFKMEEYKCRKPCEIWVVDGKEYTAPC